ncbi:MAG: ATP-binding protein [Candidatus Cyclobacteriaceae bacterium M2_1C_046]
MKGKENQPIAPSDIFSGGGKMGELMSTIDWAETPVGPVSTWPLSLKMIVKMLLHSKFGMFLWWGPELVQFYNDAYRPSFGKSGEKHPKAMGQRGEECWGEIWHIIYPQIRQVMETGVATINENQLVPIFRNNILEEVYWTYSYSPVFEESGKIGGVLVVETETTKQVIGERRMLLLRDLSMLINESKDIYEICQSTIQRLEINVFDVPFSLLYLFDEQKKQLHLKSYSSNFENYEHPEVLNKDHEDIWSVWESISSGKPMLNEILEKHADKIPGGPWPEKTDSAYTIPLISPNQNEVIGVLVAGISSRQIFDHHYRIFLDSLARYIVSGIMHMVVHEEDKKRMHEKEQLAKQKDDFIGIASHELKTPVTSLKAYTQYLYSIFMEEGNESSAQLLNKMDIQIDKLTALISDLLDVTKIEQGKIAYHMEPFIFDDLVKEVVDDLRQITNNKKIELELNCGNTVTGDRNRISQVITNFLTNAIKYAPNSKKIKATSKEKDGNMIFSVKDYGIGLNEKDKERIFERFYRVDSKKHKNSSGLGLGLYISAEIIRRHNGKIWAESENGGGAIFCFSLPIQFPN